MVQKQEMLIERFSNGISVRFSDDGAVLKNENIVAVKNQESQVVGESISEVIFDVLGQSESGLVKVKVEVQTL